MKIAEIEEKVKKIQTLRGLEKLLKTHNEALNRIDHERDDFIVTEIKFACRGISESLKVTIPYYYVRQGLVDTIENLKTNIANLIEEIEQ